MVPRDIILSLFTERQIVKSRDSFAAELLSGEANGGSETTQLDSDRVKMLFAVVVCVP